MSGSHYAPEPPSLHRPDETTCSDLDAMAAIAAMLGRALSDPPADGPIYQADTERLAARQWQRGNGDERTQYDLRTVTEREADALAQLELRFDNLVDVCERQAQRIARLEAENRAREAENKALREAVTLHADLLQHCRLTAGI